MRFVWKDGKFVEPEQDTAKAIQVLRELLAWFLVFTAATCGVCTFHICFH